MAHFAKLDENNIVTEVLVVNNDVLIDEEGGERGKPLFLLTYLKFDK
jgi:hypothetical protein